jgi:hypothetical protein
MPPKKHPETPQEQAERFKREAEKLINAGELDPKAGEEALDDLVRRQQKDDSRPPD